MSYSHINELLAEFEKDSSISDIHLAGSSPLTIRKLGRITVIEDEEHPVISDELMDRFLHQLLDKHPGGLERFDKEREIDFNFFSDSGVPYRVNAYFKLDKKGVAMRKIGYKALELTEIMYDDIAKAVISNVLNQRTGIFLVTGPTGSGKTTSLIAMLEWINNHRTEHIVTIEDPIEFIFEPKKCLVSQREFGSDTLSFEKAMRAAMRQDPDIIFVGEIRDRETAEAALNLAETGHLVFSTLHTRSASNTISRLISLFPPDIQESMKDRIAQSLLGVQSQFLLETKNSSGRVGLYELMLNSVAIRNDIRRNDGNQINSIIDTHRKEGMISLKEYAKRLIADGMISKESVDWLF